MGTFVPPGFGLISVEYSLVGDPEPMFTTWGVTLTDVPTPADLLAYYITDVQELTHMMSTDYTAIAIHCAVGQDGGPPVLVDRALADAGTGSAAACPQNVAVLIKKQTALGGRHGRGRTFWPGIPEGQVNSAGVIGSTALGDWQDAANFLEAFTDPFGPPVLLHVDASITPTPITGFLVDGRVATQRRRLRP